MFLIYRNVDKEIVGTHYDLEDTVEREMNNVLSSQLRGSRSDYDYVEYRGQLNVPGKLLRVDSNNLPVLIDDPAIISRNSLVMSVIGKLKVLGFTDDEIDLII